MFILYDELLFTNRPAPSVWGGVDIKLFYEHQFLPPGNTMPDQNWVTGKLAAYANSSELICLDVETWLTHESPQAMADAVAKYIELLGKCRIACPQARFAFYSVPPLRDYWNAIKPRNDPAYIQWQSNNTAYQALADASDVLFPSLYTFYDDVAGWHRYARENIREAQRLARGKPVLPFLWPQYHDSNAILGGQIIPGAYWRLQLETVKAARCSGAVLWGGFQVLWNNNAPWYLETQQFAAARTDRTKVIEAAIMALGARRSQLLTKIEDFNQTSIQALENELAQIENELVSLESER